MIEVNTIGISGYGSIYLELVLRLAAEGKLRLSAATVINASEESVTCEKLKKLGCRIFSDYREMLAQRADTLDLCLIPTPIHLHAEMSLRALDSGVNVLVEKPVTATIQDVLALDKKSKETGKFVAVGFNAVYTKENLQFKSLLLDGFIGKIRRIKGIGLWPRNDRYYNRNQWAGKLRVANQWVLDSPINNALSHFVHMMLFLSGDKISESAIPTSVTAELYSARAIDNFDTVCLQGITHNDIEYSFYASHSCAKHHVPEIRIEGDNGSAIWRFQREILIKSKSDAITIEQTRGILEERMQMFEKILNRVQNSNEFICDVKNAGALTLIVNGAHESSQIMKIKDSYLKKTVHDGTAHGVISGIETLCYDCFDKGKMFSETTTPWAFIGKKVNLVGYNKFPQA